MVTLRPDALSEALDQIYAIRVDPLEHDEVQPDIRKTVGAVANP